MITKPGADRSSSDKVVVAQLCMYILNIARRQSGIQPNALDNRDGHLHHSGSLCYEDHSISKKGILEFCWSSKGYARHADDPAALDAL